MPEGPDGKTIIIVKKVSGHAGHHGGAWKVAYADFVTAMMALFMVLWLVNSAAEPTRQRIASYFRKPGVFQKGSGTPLEIGGAGILPDTFAPPADANSQLLVDKKIYQVDAETGAVREYFDPKEGVGTGADGNEKGLDDNVSRAKFERIQEEKKAVEQLVQDLKEALAQQSAEERKLLGDVDIKVDQRGLLIEIMDTESASMFEVGSATIASAAEQQLLTLARVLTGLPNPVDIEGHTDGRPYRGALAGRYDNWNLSSDRANAARRALEKAGMKPEQIARVVGYADRRHKLKDDPMNPSNRRITIAMRFTEQAKVALEGTQTIETESKPLPLPSRPSAEIQQQVEQAVGQTVTQPPATAEQAPAKAVEPRPGQLKVEVGTVLPDGQPLPPEPKVQEPKTQNQPAVLEKDKIFGRSNPFFD